MPRKPVPGLPDVFAKPGGAPSRGTPIEDLPAFPTELEGHQAPGADAAGELVTSTTAAATNAAIAEPIASAAEQPQAPSSQSQSGPTHGAAASPAAGPTASSAAAPTAAPDATAAKIPTKPQAGPPQAGPPQAGPTQAGPTQAGPTQAGPTQAGPTQAKPARGGVPAIVWVVLVASLTAPLWEGTVLSGLGIHTQTARSAAANATALAQQDARLAVLEGRLASTATQLDAIRADLALATLRATEATTQARAVALLRLRDALRASAPFGIELTVLHATGGDTGKLQAALAQLAPYVTTGAPSLDQLQRDLRILNDSVVRAFRQANPGSWMDIINWTRPGGVQSPAQIDPNVRAAQLGLSRLAAGDVPGAIEQASQVDGPYQTDFADWVAEAKGRLAADTALREIDNLITHPASTAVTAPSCGAYRRAQSIEGKLASGGGPGLRSFGLPPRAGSPTPQGGTPAHPWVWCWDIC